MAVTERTDCTFTIKEHLDGSPFIMLEPYAPGLPVIGDGFLGLELREGVTMEQAKALVEMLNARVEQISHTRFSG